MELPDHVNDLFLQTVEGLDLPHDTVEGVKALLFGHPRPPEESHRLR